MGVLAALVELCPVDDERLIGLLCRQLVPPNEEFDGYRHFALNSLYHSSSDFKSPIEQLCACFQDNRREVWARCFAAEALTWMFEGRNGNSLKARESHNIQLPPGIELVVWEVLQRVRDDERADGHLRDYAACGCSAIEMNFDGPWRQHED